MRIKEFLSTIEGLATNTRNAYEQTLWQLFNKIKGQEPTTDEIYNFLRRYPASSLHRHKAAIKAYLEYRYPGQPWPFTRRQFIAPRRHIPRYVSASVVQEIASSAENEDDRMFVQTLFQIGCRIRELMGIEDTDVSEAGVTVLTKGGQHRLKPVTKEFSRVLSTYAKGKKGKLFPHSYNYYYTKLRELGAQVGHPEIAPHMLRHCLSPDTMVISPNGAQPIFNLLLQNTPITAVDIKRGLTFDGVVDSKSAHTGEMLEVWAGGRRIQCSPEHRLFKSDFCGGIKEINVGDLRRGMYLAGVRELTPVNRELFQPHIWRFIGYFLGDGYMREREICVYDKKQEILQFYLNILTEKGIKGQISPYKNRNGLKLTISNVCLDTFLRQMGMEIRSGLRRVPLQAFQSRKDDIAQLIAGFYDAEGNEGKICRFFGANVRLLQDIQTLLLYLGINSCLSERWRIVTLPQGKKIHTRIYTLRIQEQESLLKFRATIPTLKKVEPIGEGFSKEIVPIGHYLRYKVKERQKSGIPIWTKYPRSLARYSRENHQPTRRNLLAWQGIIGTPIIRKMLSFYWLKVTRIKKINYTTTLIDIGVKPTEAFIADGFISHNSRAVDLLMKGMPLPFVQQILGHASINTTAIYTEITGGELGKQLEKVEANG